MSEKPESRLSTLRELWRPRLVRWFVYAWGAVAGYDGVSSQTGLPKIREMWGVSGALMPWWGWFLVLLVIFVYALFEYARTTRQLVLDSVPVVVSPSDQEEPLRIDTPPPPTKPDLSFDEVRRRVVGARGGQPVFMPPDFWEQISLAIVDGIKLNELTVWARWEKRAIEPISRSELNYGRIDSQAETLKTYNGYTNVTYHDLQFVRAEIDEIWPDVPEEDDESEDDVPF